MSERRRTSPRRTARGGLPIQGALPPRRPPVPAPRRRWPFVALALVVVALTAGVAARRVIDGGYFRVEEPVISGALLVDPEAVRAAAALDGDQIWEVSGEEVSARVRALPGVREARVERGLPNRVRIAVEERLPAAVWRIGAVDTVVDDDGYVVAAPAMGGMPAIAHLDGRPGLGPGDRVDADAIRLAFALLERLPVAAGQRVARFEYTSAGGLDALTDRGLRLRFGDGQNLDHKLALWRSIDAQAKKDKINPSEVDLRYGQWAAFR